MAAENRRRARRHALIVALKIAVSAGLLTVLLRRIETGTIVQELRHASLPWIAAALVLYGVMLAVSAWRWQQLLRAQGVGLRLPYLFESFLVATFFSNFLPSNVGGDVVRVTDTASAAGSKTLAATVVLIDRGVGVLGLLLVAAVGGSLAGSIMLGDGAPLSAVWLWAGLAGGTALSLPLLLAPQIVHRIVAPIRRVHPEWIDERLDRLTGALARFRQNPVAMLGCFAGAVVVQMVLVLFYYALARSVAIPIGVSALALLVPVSFLVQMLPISINGLGVREATFGLFFLRLGLPLHSALLLSLGGAAAVMAISVLGAGAYVWRIRHLRFSTLDVPHSQA
jgi:glycosyltransferase 2 family protein